MSQIASSAIVSVTAALLLPGCGAMHSARMAATEAVAALRPTSFDYTDATDDIGDPWIQAAGDEARGHRPKEKSEDPDWLRNLMMSPKARDIENNLGIE